MTLHDALSGLPVVSVIRSPSPNRSPEHPDRETTHDNIVLVWASAPSPANVSAADAIIASYDPTPTVDERLDEIALKRRLMAALVVRMSGSWAGLSPARKAKVQEIIDAGALTIIAELLPQGGQAP